MNSVGRILRSARERQGRAVAEIADELCLTQQYLRAIEEDDVKSLPGTFFYKNFVKQYAAIVGVKESEIRAGIEALTAAAEEPALPGTLAQPPVRPLDPIVADSNRRYFANTRLGLSVAGLVVVLMACSGFYAWWMRPKEVAAAKPRPLPAVVRTSSSQRRLPWPSPRRIRACPDRDGSGDRRGANANRGRDQSGGLESCGHRKNLALDHQRGQADFLRVPGAQPNQDPDWPRRRQDDRWQRRRD